MTKNHESPLTDNEKLAPTTSLGWAAVEAAISSPDTIPSSRPPEGYVYRRALDEFRAGTINSDTGELYEVELVTEERREELRQQERFRPLQGELPEDDIEFKENIKYLADSTLDEPPRVIYNPGCGEHVSVATTFPDARTIFVDPDGNVEHRFLERQTAPENDIAFEFYRDDMHTFILPDNLKADLLLLLNAEQTMTQEELNNVMQVGGVVAANNWHGAANYIADECPNYQLTGRFSNGGDSSHELYAFKRMA